MMWCRPNWSVHNKFYISCIMIILTHISCYIYLYWKLLNHKLIRTRSEFSGLYSNFSWHWQANFFYGNFMQYLSVTLMSISPEMSSSPAHQVKSSPSSPSFSVSSSLEVLQKSLRLYILFCTKGTKNNLFYCHEGFILYSTATVLPWPITNQFSSHVLFSILKFISKYYTTKVDRIYNIQYN